MTKNSFFLMILILLITANFGVAQNIGTQTKLANSYFNDQEFDKAESIYKELYQKTNSTYYYSRYITCLCEQNKFTDAEREVKREMRRNRKALSFYVEMAFIYRQQKKDDKADKTIEEAIDKLSSRKHEIHTLANSLIIRREYDNAIKVYQKAESLLGKKFNREIATIYLRQKKYPEMINKYMDWAEERPSNIKTVQNQIQYFITHDHDGSFFNIMRTELLKRIQVPKASTVNNKMLFWLYMQKKDFRQALIQAKAIDRRTFSSGRAIKNLAEAACNSGNYDVAQEAWQYLMDKGSSGNSLFIDAKLGRLEVLYKKIEDGIISDIEQIQNIAKEYDATLKQLGIGETSYKGIINLAQIQTFYLDEADKADALLSKASQLSGLSGWLVAVFKITRGDILLFKGDLWEAALLFAQVENENKDKTMGDDAKLKKALTAYYGERYEWALAQFNALKKSTSKNVANDALSYAIFIEEQMQEDSLHQALLEFSGAELLQFQRKPKEALVKIDSLIEKYPESSIKVHAYFKRAELSEDLKLTKEAQRFYKKVISEFSSSILKPVALLKLGILYEEQLKNNEEATHYYKKLISENPESMHTNEAAKRLRAIRENNL